MGQTGGPAQYLVPSQRWISLRRGPSRTAQTPRDASGMSRNGNPPILAAGRICRLPARQWSLCSVSLIAQASYAGQVKHIS